MSLFDQDMASGLLATQINSPSGNGNVVLVGFDKAATGYALDTADLGGFAAGQNGADNVVGEFPGSTTSPLCYTPSGGTSANSCTPPTTPYHDNGYLVNNICNGSSDPNTSSYTDPYQWGECDMITSQVYWHDSSSGADYLFVFPTGEDLDWCYWDSAAGANGNFVCTPDATHISSDPRPTICRQWVIPAVAWSSRLTAARRTRLVAPCFGFWRSTRLRRTSLTSTLGRAGPRAASQGTSALTASPQTESPR